MRILQHNGYLKQNVEAFWPDDIVAQKMKVPWEVLFGPGQQGVGQRGGAKSR